MDVDLAAAESFLEVAEFKHFGNAAAKLGISVSELAERISRLEVSLGVPLVEGDAGGFLGLTPAGWRFLRVVPSTLGAAAGSGTASAGEPVSTLRLAVPAGVGVVPPLFPKALATLGLTLRHAHPRVALEPVPTPFEGLTADLVSGSVDLALAFGASGDPAVESSRLSEIDRVGLVGRSHPLAVKRAVRVAEFARLPMLHPTGLPEEYAAPFLLADVRPLSEADLRDVDASRVALRLLEGSEVAVVPLALTANLPPELKRVGLTGCPRSWYHAQRRRGDERPEVLTAIDLMADFIESVSRAALRAAR